MPSRPQVRAPAFGVWLASCRGQRSLEQIAQRLRPLVERTGLKVDRSTIKKAEQGRVPNWPLLAAFSRVYGVPFTDTVDRLIASLEFPAARELLGGARSVNAHDDAARTRIRELEDQIKLYETFLRHARALTDELHAFTSTGPEVAEPSDSARRTRRR